MIQHYCCRLHPPLILLFIHLSVLSFFSSFFGFNSC
eukprot:UN00134